MEEGTHASDIIHCQCKGVPLLKAPAWPTAPSKYVREAMRGDQERSGTGPTPPTPQSSAQQVVSNVSSSLQRLRVGEVNRPFHMPLPLPLDCHGAVRTSHGLSQVP